MLALAFLERKRCMKFYQPLFKDTKRKHLYLFNPRITLAELFFTALGTVFGIGILAFLSDWNTLIYLVPPFGASAVLLYAAPTVALAQPRNVIGGHIVAATTGVAIHLFLGTAWWAITLAVTLAILLMSLTETLHPPGGATAIVAMLAPNITWGFILFPIGFGAVIMVIVAILSNRFSEDRPYPNKK